MQFSILGKEKVEQIHQATLRVLSKTGIILTHPQARNLLSEHGAIIKGERRVLLPRELVEKCVGKIPRSVKLQGRDPDQAIELPSDSYSAHNVGGVPNIYDPKDHTRRPAERGDVVHSTRLLDALHNVSSVTPLFTPQDVPGNVITLWMTFDTLANTTKPFRSPGVQTGREVEAISEMFQIACPDGSLTIGISPISPLTFPDDIVEAILTTARRGHVLGPLPCPILGATAPMSITGGLTQQNAEVLASVVLAQLTNPGLPMIYKGRLSVMDPRTGLSVWGNPEIGMVSAATVEIGHYYGMPVDVYGLCTSALKIDIQSGYERAINVLLPVLAGADEISGVGEMDGGISASLAQMVIDDEILSSVKRVQQSFELDVSADEVIANVMNGSHHFLAEKHTVKYLRSGEVLRTKLALRNSWFEWEKSGREDLLDRAEDKAASLLASHEVLPLNDHQTDALKGVIESFT